MKISKIFFFIILLSFTGCGIKSDPIAKSSLDLPLPDKVNYNITGSGIEIYNGSDDYTLFVERAEDDKGFLNLSKFVRITLINPKQRYLDDTVINGKVYKYRFRHYYSKLRTFSPALIKTIKYYQPIKLENVSITQNKNNVCISTKLNNSTISTDVLLNGVKTDNIPTGIRKCFEMPYTSTVTVVLIPYDYNNNSGIAYKTDIKNMYNKNLPPQNIIVRRNDKDIIISWDDDKKTDAYNIYLKTNNRLKKISTIDVSLFRYKAKSDDCVDFAISSIRDGKETKKINISACN